MPPVIGMSSARQASAIPLDRFDELPHDLGALGIAEIQAVGRSDRHARRRRRRCAPPRPPPASRRVGVEIAVAPIAIDGDAPARATCPSHARLQRPCRRARACWCAPCGRTGDRSSACSRSSARPGAQAAHRPHAERRQLRQVEPGDRVEVSRPRHRSVVDGRLVDERGVGNLGDDFAVVLHPQQPVVGDMADVRRVQDPTSRRSCSTSASRPRLTTSSMRSCDSESMIS